MDVFKPTRLAWWQLGLLKWAVFIIGLGIGAIWPEVFNPYAIPLIVIGLILSVYLFFVWARNK